MLVAGDNKPPPSSDVSCCEGACLVTSDTVDVAPDRIDGRLLDKPPLLATPATFVELESPPAFVNPLVSSPVVLPRSVPPVAPLTATVLVTPSKALTSTSEPALLKTPVGLLTTEVTEPAFCVTASSFPPVALLTVPY